MHVTKRQKIKKCCMNEEKKKKKRTEYENKLNFILQPVYDNQHHKVEYNSVYIRMHSE